MTAAREALWRRLSDAGVVNGVVPPPLPPPAPWYVRAMLGAAGWLGAMFLLGFVGAGLAFVFRNEAAALVVGAGCCAAAFVVFRSMGRNDLAAQFALAVSLAGQVMVIYGLHETLSPPEQPAVFLLEVAIFEGLLAFVVDNFVHRVWTTLAAGVAFVFSMNMLGLFGIGTAAIAAALAVLWLSEPDWAARGTKWRAIGYGLAIGLLLPDTTILGGLDFWRRGGGPVFHLPGIWWAEPILVGAVLVYIVHRLTTRDAGSRPQTAALAAAAAVALVSYRSPGIGASLIVLLLGFARGNRSLLGLGVAGMLGYLSYFYYSLEATLLMKSFALTATGLVLLALWGAMRAMFGARIDEGAGA